MRAVQQPEGRDINEWSAEILAHHARTFNLAGWLLPPESRRDAAVLYAFCRHVDDLADEAASKEIARVGLQGVEAELLGESPAGPLTGALLELAERRQIPLQAALELIAGVRGDLEEVLVADDGELIRYCYRVAGTVGLMMCGVIGVDDPDAAPHAIDLGIGMQLTNISRDVVEDAGRGRVYLPEARLRAAGTSQEELLAGTADPDAVGAVVGDVLAIAETYYDSATDGFRYIPLSTRTAIMSAAWMYRAIGRKIVARGYHTVLDGRTVVDPLSKAGWVGRALLASPDVARRHRRQHCASLHGSLGGLPGANHH